MTATFILSLDCEGKWGMADKITDYHDHHLTTAKLSQAYASLLALFERYEIPVTFAFVMAFLLSAEEQRRNDHLFPTCDVGSQWLSRFRDAQARGSSDGWAHPDLLDRVRDEGRHEIACHGFSHLPLDRSITPQAAAAEFAACRQVADMRGVALETLVYPRNQVGHVDQLQPNGFTGFRDRLARPEGKAGMLMALASEFNIYERTQPACPPARDEAVRIPAGYFFNWRVGARKRVPRAVTKLRWKNLLDRSGADDVVHLWLHPHNIITGPETLGSLEEVLREVADRRHRGKVETMTQADYCRRIAA